MTIDPQSIQAICAAAAFFGLQGRALQQLKAVRGHVRKLDRRLGRVEDHLGTRRMEREDEEEDAA